MHKNDIKGNIGSSNNHEEEWENSEDWEKFRGDLGSRE